MEKDTGSGERESVKSGRKGEFVKRRSTAGLSIDRSRAPEKRGESKMADRQRVHQGPCFASASAT